MKRLLYHLSIKLLQWSGTAGADEWQAQNKLIVSLYDSQNRTYEAVIAAKQYISSLEKNLKAAVETLALVDGLLSTNQPDIAQAQIRALLIMIR